MSCFDGLFLLLCVTNCRRELPIRRFHKPTYLVAEGEEQTEAPSSEAPKAPSKVARRRRRRERRRRRRAEGAEGAGKGAEGAGKEKDNEKGS